ncbi:MAG: hypothetical protein DCC59_10090 [Chloroflexi bacterium]|nr:hypothetical protein [Chloroflexi bacterium CFX1]MCQ3953822.1 hypothetical protein [Chloroflexota bacterium]RIK52480.1 MAG: hypothetical protein DCC59_10090 [Chloroflexota bacterium]
MRRIVPLKNLKMNAPAPRNFDILHQITRQKTAHDGGLYMESAKWYKLRCGRAPARIAGCFAL